MEEGRVNPTGPTSLFGRKFSAPISLFPRSNSPESSPKTGRKFFLANLLGSSSSKPAENDATSTGAGSPAGGVSQGKKFQRNASAPVIEIPPPPTRPPPQLRGKALPKVPGMVCSEEICRL